MAEVKILLDLTCEKKVILVPWRSSWRQRRGGRSPKRERSRRDWSAAFAALTLTCLFLATGPATAADDTISDKPLSENEASEKLRQIEKWSKEAAAEKNPSSPGTEVQNAVVDLQKNPKAAVPLYSKAFIDKTKARAFRLNCAQLLRESGGTIPTEDAVKLEAVVGDSQEDPLIRIFAAHFILKDTKSHPASLKGSIANMAVDFIRKGKEKDFVRMLIIPFLVGTRQVEEVMLEELRAEQNIDATLYALGKLRSTKAIPAIVRLLKSDHAGRTFYKTRAYLALGEIGGASATFPPSQGRC